MDSVLKSKIWSWVKTFLKIGITSFALYWVFINTDLKELYQTIRGSNPYYIFLAFIAFIISQLFASSRINTFFEAISLHLSFLYNYKLYLVGMFYNMFLPGGIGGDGYKIFFLNKTFGSETKKLFIAKFLDKLSGVWAICFLMLSQILFIPSLNISNYIIITLLIAGTVACFIFYQLFFPTFKPYFLKTHVKAFVLQTCQLCCVACILLGIGVDDFLLPYLIIFLASAFMALFPFTIGGLGAREIVFLYGAKYFELDPQIAVTISLLFFAVSAICSLPGAYFVLRTSSLAPEKNKLKNPINS